MLEKQLRILLHIKKDTRNTTDHIIIPVDRKNRFDYFTQECFDKIYNKREYLMTIWRLYYED